MVVGERLPNGKSIVKPRSYCDNCKHSLSVKELIPIFSYLYLGGKCLKCHKKIGIIYPLFELISGVLFVTAYLVFGLSLELLVALTFISILLTIIISDYKYMIICDEVLIVGDILLIIELFIWKGLNNTLLSILNGIFAFMIMFIIKKLGDLLFKRESMGGGDIKLMFTFGLVLGLLNSVMCIFLASLIGLPISLILMNLYNDHEVPFGPYLAFAAIVILLTQFNYLNLI